MIVAYRVWIYASPLTKGDINLLSAHFKAIKQYYIEWKKKGEMQKTHIKNIHLYEGSVNVQQG